MSSICGRPLERRPELDAQLVAVDAHRELPQRTVRRVEAAAVGEVVAPAVARASDDRAVAFETA